MKRLFLIVVGYFIAATVATFCAVLLLTIMDRGFTGQNAAQFSDLYDIALMFLIGLQLTALTAWPTFIATIIIAAKKQITGLWFFAFMGVVASLQALAVINIEHFFRTIFEFWFVIPAGFAGGFAYAYWQLWLSKRLCAGHTA